MHLRLFYFVCEIFCAFYSSEVHSQDDAHYLLYNIEVFPYSQRSIMLYIHKYTLHFALLIQFGVLQRNQAELRMNMQTGMAKI